MSESKIIQTALFVTTFTVAIGLDQASQAASAHQYEHENIAIPAARADEPVRKTFSAEAAFEYLDEGARAWTNERQCVSCHTNGSYLLTRPALTSIAGPPSRDVRDFFETELAAFKKQTSQSLQEGITPTQLAYLAAGLAQWDQYVEGKESQATHEALELMFSAQSDNGSFANDDGWPPLESSEYHGATVAALALLAAPRWASSSEGQSYSRHRDRLWTYLRATPPPHDYARVLLLWVASCHSDLLPEDLKTDLIKRLLNLQNTDGGWALRQFATPEKWGRGNRAEKLRSESAFATPSSDGHQTGLTAYVLMKAGLEPGHPAIQQAIQWLLQNQRQSGRWWTRSLNTDKFHFITYSATCYALLALEEAGILQPIR